MGTASLVIHYGMLITAHPAYYFKLLWKLENINDLFAQIGILLFNLLEKDALK